MLGALEPGTFQGTMCQPAAARTVERVQAQRRAARVGSVRSGCRAGTDGVVRCDPERMRQAAEAFLRETGFFPRSKSLSFDVYAMARNIKSEAGSGTGSEKLAIGEALINRAREKGVSMFSLMSRGGFFSRQRGCSPCVSSRQDPEVEDIIAAELVLAGKSGGIARGATHYFSPRSQNASFRRGTTSKDALTIYNSWTGGGDLLAWVGYVPGIDLGRQMFFRRMPKSDAGRQFHAAMRLIGRSALQQSTPPEVLAAPLCGLALGAGDGAPLVLVGGLGLLLASATAFFMIIRYGGLRR